MPYLKLILGFFLFAFILLAFLFIPAGKEVQAHSIYCGVPPESWLTHTSDGFAVIPGPYVLVNIPPPTTVTPTASGLQIRFDWSATTGCYGIGIPNLSPNWIWTTATSYTFTGTPGITYQARVFSVDNIDVGLYGYCCHIGHPSGWNHRAGFATYSTLSTSVTAAPPFTITSLTALACDGGPTQPVRINWSGTPAGTTSFSIQRGTTSTSTVGIDTISNGAATSYIDNGPARPPSAGTYYYLIQALPSSTNTGLPGPGVSVAACFNYSLTNNGNITASQGSSGSNLITANLTVAPTQAVSFSASGLPAGATAAFSPTSCNPTCSSTLTISTTASTPLGTYPITVTGTPLGRTTSFNLIVTGPPGPFSSPLVASTTPGCSGSTPIVNLSWGTSSGATSYTILRDGLAIATGWTSTTYVDNVGLAAGTLYTYQIQAVNSLGSLLSNTASATALDCANPIVDLMANGQLAGPGGSISIPPGTATLTWSSLHTTGTCSATRNWAAIGSKALNNDVGESTPTLVFSGSPYTSTLTCANANAIPPTPPSRVFVTSTTYRSNLGGLDVADSACQTRANAVPLGGTWRAWLSDDADAPFTRFIRSSGPYQLVNGTPVANNWADLTDATPLLNPINMTESRDIVTVFPWTGTNALGNATNDHCNNWTDNNDSFNGYYGSSSSTSGTWTTFALAGCDGGLRPLYCFEQVPPPLPPSASDSVTITITAPPPWIQTTGGDVHSNIQINTPGGP